jgi:hypothetical protein
MKALLLKRIMKGMTHLRRRLSKGDPKVNCFCEDAEGSLWVKDRLVVPKKAALKKKILKKAHTSRYSIHPGSTKIYQDLRQQLWWTRMKCEAALYVIECDTCRKIKADYMKSRGLLEPLSIPAWKWDDISMDFIVGLPLTARKFNLIWVIVEIYIARVLCLHRVPKTTVSDRGSQFIARFWEQLHPTLRTHLIYSLAYHPQTDGQTERVNQILKDMLGACVMEHQGSWDKNLPWAEFSYNNSYHKSLKMAPFEVLCGCRCYTPLNWIEPREKVIFGPDLIDEAKTIVRRIQENLKAARSRQESYAYKRC